MCLLVVRNQDGLSTNIQDGISPWTLLVVRNQGILFYPRCESQTQTMYSQSKVKLTLTSVSPLMNTLNTDACDTEIKKEGKKKKKKPCDIEMRRR